MHENSILMEQYKTLQNGLLAIFNELVELSAALDISVVVDENVSKLIMINTAGKQRISNQKMIHRNLADVISEHSEALFKPFSVAFIGEFSRGKSTLINALLQKEILVPDFRPNTAVRTVIRHGLPQRIRIVHHDNRPIVEQGTNDLQRDLAKVTSDANAGDDQSDLLNGTRKSLAQEYRVVEVYSDLPILIKRGIELIDTPGLGSVFEAHHSVAFNVATTSDVVFYVMQFDPGIAEEDITFLNTVRDHLDHFLFIITKSDMASNFAKLESVQRFIMDVIVEKIGITQPTVLPVSAKLAGAGQLQKSGFSPLLQSLDDLLARGAGFNKLQNSLGFARSGLLCLENTLDALRETNKNHVQTLQIELHYQMAEQMQIQRVLESIGFLLDNLSTTLARTLIGRLGTFAQALQNAFYKAIDRMDLTAFANPGPVLLNSVQQETDAFLSNALSDIRNQGEQIRENFGQVVSALISPTTQIRDSRDGKREVLQFHDLSFPIQVDRLPPLWRTIPGGASVLANFGLKTGFDSIRTFCKRWAWRPYVGLNTALAEMVLNGISFKLTEKQGIREVRLSGIRSDLEATLTTACQDMKKQIYLSLTTTLQPDLERIDQTIRHIQQDLEVNKDHQSMIESQQQQVHNIWQAINRLAEQVESLRS